MAKETRPPITIQLRPGVSPFLDLGEGWRGENSESDAGSLKPNELQRGINVRQRGQSLYARPGVYEVVDVDQPITWMGEVPTCPSVRLWFTTFGCFGAGTGSAGCAVSFYDPLANPQLQQYGLFRSVSDRGVDIDTYSGKLFIGDKTALREIIAMLPPAGQNISDLVPSPPQTPTLDFPGFTIKCLKEFDGRYFIGLANDVTPAASKIVCWDGLEMKDDITGIDPPVAFGIRQDTLVVGFGAATANIRWRSTGAAPGTWTTVALAGMVTSAWGNAMQEVGQYLWIASGTNLIHRFDGTALTLQRTVATAAVDGNGVTGLTLHDGLLHYLWNTAGAAYATTIGRHDPASTAANEWIDAYRTITAVEPLFCRGLSILSFQSQIFIGGGGPSLMATAFNDVKGTPIPLLLQLLVDVNFPIIKLVRHP